MSKIGTILNPRGHFSPHALTLALLSLLLLVPGSAVIAQSESGSAALEGTVTDTNGAAVAGASVTIRNVETGLERAVTTDGGGRYSARVLPVGRYTVRVEAGGFAAATRDEVVLRVGEATPVDLFLRPAAVSERVEVIAGGETIDTETSSTGTTITPRLVQDLPIRGRNFTEFVQLTPAVVQEADRSGLVISGQRSINSNVAVDGADFNDALQGNQRGGNESVFFFPQTAVREFQVVRSGANAEVGRTSAGFVNVVTKSGTNNFNGEAFYFNRNRRLTSPNAFGRSLDNAQNQFGGSLGGPIARDRAFFFFGIEQNYLRVPFVVEFQPVASSITVPADVLALTGEQRGTNNPTALFARTDFTLNESNNLNVQYTYTRLRGENFNFDSPRQDAAASSNYTRVGSTNGLKGSLVSVLNANIVNEARAQVATDHRLEDPNSNLPQVSIAGFGTLGGDSGRPRQFDTTRFQFTDNLSVNAGAHNLRFGLDANINRLRQQRESNIQGRYDFESRTIGTGGGAVVVPSISNYIALRPRRYRQTLPGFNPEDLTFRGTQKEFAVFVQDRINVSRQLTVNAGLRYEAQFNPQPTNPNPLIPQTARIPNDTTMFQPRLGLAYDVGGAGRTVIRLAAGLYAARTPGNLFQRVFTDNGLTTQAVDISETTACRNSTVVNLAGCRLRGPNAILTFPNALAAIPAGFITAPRVFGFDPNFKNPRSFQTSATLEQRIGDDLALTAGYIHNSTWNLQRRLDRNLFPPTINAAGLPIFPTTRPNPAIGILSVNESSAHSTYDALTLSLTRRFSLRYQTQVTYTFARNRDDDSNERNFSRESALNPFDLRLEEGPSKQDVRHNLNVSGLVDLGRGFSVSGIIITRSGFPFTPVTNADSQNDGNDDNDRAVIDGRVSGRNSFRQRYFFNLDLRLLKGFRFGETRRIDLSAEVFNVTRNTNKNFGNDSISEYTAATIANGTALQPLFAPSTARFGGPRQLQLGVRFAF